MGGCSKQKIDNDDYDKIIASITSAPEMVEKYKEQIEVRDERAMQVTIHEMTNTLIIAVDNIIRGTQKITPERCN